MDLNGLQRQAAIARSLRQQQNTHKAKLPSRAHGTASSYDAESGMDIIRLGDGSTSYALPDTSGVRSPGDSVVVRTGAGTTHIDAMKPKRFAPLADTRKLIKKVEEYPFKILFSVTENNIKSFYIGGDRKEPFLIVSLSADDFYVYESYISNTGSSKDNWTVTMRYQEFNTNNTITRSFGHAEDTWQFTSPPSPNEHPSLFTDYRGGGVWLSEDPKYVNTRTSRTVDTNPNNDAEEYITYPIDRSPLFMSCGGERRVNRARTGGNCQSDGTPYVVDGSRFYRPSHETTTDNNYGDMGSFLVFKNQVNTQIGEYRNDYTDVTDRLCADNLERSGKLDSIYYEQLTHYLSTTIIGIVEERFENHEIYTGIDYNGWSDITPEYRYYEDSNLIVGSEGVSCITVSSEYKENVTEYGKNGIVLKSLQHLTNVQFFLNITALKEKELNNSPTFSFVCEAPLNLNENTLVVNVPTGFYGISSRMYIPIDIYTGYDNEERNSKPLNFEFLNQSVKISQSANLEQTECWTVLGTISSVEFGQVNEDINQFRKAYITSMVINVTNIKKTKHDSLASVNGTVSCLNNLLLPLFYFDDGFFHPEITYKGGTYAGEYSKVDYRVTNFVNDKIYFSRLCPELISTSGTNYVEVWELKDNNGKLDIVEKEIKSGNVYSLSEDPNYKNNPNIDLRIESISYFA